MANLYCYLCSHLSELLVTNASSRFSLNSVAEASELLENPEEMFPLHYTDNKVPYMMFTIHNVYSCHLENCSLLFKWVRWHTQWRCKSFVGRKIDRTNHIRTVTWNHISTVDIFRYNYAVVVHLCVLYHTLLYHWSSRWCTK